MHPTDRLANRSERATEAVERWPPGRAAAQGVVEDHRTLGAGEFAHQRLGLGVSDRPQQRRVALYNVWKPLYRRVEELPLAMCDARTHDAGDMLRMDLKYRERTGEIYVMRHSAQHRWFYFPLMEPSHALLLKTFDSETDGRARFMGHSAFEDPETRADAPRRESIEVRTMAFF